MTFLIEFKRCGFKKAYHAKRGYKHLGIEKSPAVEMELFFVYILIYFGSLMRDIKQKYERGRGAQDG